MKAFLALLGLSFKSLLLTSFSVSRSKGGKRKKAISGVGALVLLSILMLYLSGVYSFGLGAAMAAAGGLDLMVALMAMVAMLFPTFFILFAAQSQVFSTKDIDLVMSLPVSSFSIMLARVLAMYLEALLMCELLLVPAGVAYAFYGGAGAAGVIIRLLVLGVFLALVPTLLSLVFGSLIALLTAKMRRFKSLFTVVLSLLLMVGIFALSFGSSSVMSGQAAIDATALRSALYGALPPLGWAMEGVMGNLPLLLLVIAGILLPFLLVVWLFSRIYKRLLTGLSSTHLRSNYKLGRLSASGSFSALLKKEAGKFFGTPSLVLNGGIMSMLLILASVAAVIFKGSINEFLAAVGMAGGGQALQQLLPPILLGAACMFGTMVFISCVSISLEGKTLWILKEASVGTGRIFAAKAGFNFLVGGITLLVSLPLLGYALSIPALQVGLMLLVGLLFSFLTSLLGLYINLLLPRMDAENDTMVVKQSASVLVMTLLDFVLLGGGVGLFFLLGGLGFELFALITAAILLGLSAITLLLLNTSGRKLFASL